MITADEKTGKLFYGSGRSVVIRSIADPLKAELFTEHSKDVTIARVRAPAACTIKLRLTHSHREELTKFCGLFHPLLVDIWARRTCGGLSRFCIF